jgi:hypothetical protein
MSVNTFLGGIRADFARLPDIPKTAYNTEAVYGIGEKITFPQ